MNDPVFEYNIKVFDAIFGKNIMYQKKAQTVVQGVTLSLPRQKAICDLPTSPFAGMYHGRTTGKGV